MALGLQDILNPPTADSNEAFHNYRFSSNLRIVFWVSVGIVVLTSGLLIVDVINYNSGVWAKEPEYKTIAYLRLGLLVSLSIILWPQRNRDWDRKITFRDKLLSWVLIGYILAWCVATSVIAFSIHGQIVIFIIALLTGCTVLIIRYYEAILAFGISFVALAAGILLLPNEDLDYIGTIIGAATVTVVSIFIATFNYRRSVTSYNDRQTIIRQNKELETAARDIEELLKEREKELRDFIYASSHDLRAPVAEIKGLWEVFKEEKGLDEMQRSFIEVGRDRTRLLDKYTRNLTGITETRRHPVKAEKIDIKKLIEKCTSAHIFLEEEVIPRIELAPETDDFVVGDSYRIWLILANLLDNAIHYQRKDEPDPKGTYSHNGNGYETKSRGRRQWRGNVSGICQKCMETLCQRKNK
jgi:signal transduction histidine kinase